MFEAVNAIVGGYTPYLGTIEARRGASPEAAAIAAAHRTLVSLHPTSAVSLDAARNTSLAAIADGAAKDDGIAVGVAAADAMLALRASDGAAKAGVPPYMPRTETRLLAADAANVGPGALAQLGQGDHVRDPPWRAIPRRTAAGTPHRQVRRAITTRCRPWAAPRAPTVLRTRPISRGSSAATFRCTCSTRRRARRAWRRARALAENARSFALLNMAVTDGLISSMESKFYYESGGP